MAQNVLCAVKGLLKINTRRWQVFEHCSARWIFWDTWMEGKVHTKRNRIQHTTRNNGKGMGLYHYGRSFRPQEYIKETKEKDVEWMGDTGMHLGWISVALAQAGWKQNNKTKHCQFVDCFWSLGNYLQKTSCWFTESSLTSAHYRPISISIIRPCPPGTPPRQTNPWQIQIVWCHLAISSYTIVHYTSCEIMGISNSYLHAF